MAKNIVLIDPDVLLAKSYVAALSSAGYKVFWCADGQEAIHCIDSTKPLLIILEVQLPSHNGIEFLHELRSYDDLQQIPIVLLSYVAEQDLKLTPKAKKALAIRRYHYKPLTSLTQLVQTVHKTVTV